MSAVRKLASQAVRAFQESRGNEQYNPSVMGLESKSSDETVKEGNKAVAPGNCCRKPEYAKNREPVLRPNAAGIKDKVR